MRPTETDEPIEVQLWTGPKEPALDGCPDPPWRKAVLGSFPAIESIAIVKCAITSAYAY